MTVSRSAPALIGTLTVLVGATSVAAQTETPRDALTVDSLVRVALLANPDLKAMEARASAFESRIAPAGAWDDPRFSVGVVNLPLPSLDFDGTPMTQGAKFTLQERVAFPGKLGLREAIAKAEHSTVAAEATDKRFEIITAVRAAYYDLYTVERSLEISRRHKALLDDFVRVANVRYRVGSGLQQDVLKANVERDRVTEKLLRQTAQREAAVARLNSLLDRPPGTPAEAPNLPERLVRLAFASDDTATVKFAAAVNQEPAIPSLASLIDSAIAQRPLLEAYRSAIDRQRLATDLARKSLWPDVTVSLGYAYRGAGLADFFSASIGLSLPVFAGRKQNRLIDAARAGELQSEAAYRNAVNLIASRLADLRARLIEERQQVTLYRDGILPQATAALQSTTSAYQVGSVDFLTLINSETTLYRYELDYHRLLASFMRTAADIERTVGREIFSQ
ncbi:MAG: TolC family protein [Gemmatimonadales bacterium]